MERGSSALSFLEEYGFSSEDSCGYGCCKGFFRGFYSDNKAYYNRTTVWLSSKGSGEAKITATNHKEYNCGGIIGTKSDFITAQGDIQDTIVEAEILILIDSVLPCDLD